MDDLIEELNKRHELVMAKQGAPFILAVCDYPFIYFNRFIKPDAVLRI